MMHLGHGYLSQSYGVELRPGQPYAVAIPASMLLATGDTLGVYWKQMAACPSLVRAEIGVMIGASTPGDELTALSVGGVDATAALRDEVQADAVCTRDIAITGSIPPTADVWLVFVVDFPVELAGPVLAGAMGQDVCRAVSRTSANGSWWPTDPTCGEVTLGAEPGLRAIQLAYVATPP